MRKIKEVLRFKFEWKLASERQIAKAVGCGRTAVGDYLRRAKIAKIDSWEYIRDLSEEELEARLFPEMTAQNLKIKMETARPLPNWSEVHQELKRRDHQVTLALLWQEYKEENPLGYQYSWFTECYHAWAKKLTLSMRQTHIAGEKVFVDFCDGILITDPVTSEKTKTHLFVGTLGASSYTFAKAVLSQEVPQWLHCHVKMYEFFGGVSQITVPDNLLSGITKACRYEAQINLSYEELSRHYGTCIIPARVRKPKDKGKVEAAVLVAQRWILAVLRHRTFYSIKELNDAIAPLLLKLNQKKMRAIKKSRLELFLEIEQAALKPLPQSRYEFADWKRVSLNIDYHLDYDDHYYSVPYTLYGQELWVRAGHETIEVFHRGKRVASHPRSFVKYKATTLPEHMPSAHRAHAEWTPSRITEWAGSIGPMTSMFVKKIIESKPHPEQGYRSALGIIRLEKTHTKARVEKACEKALLIGAFSYRTVKTMLQNKMESAPLHGEIRPGAKRVDPDQLDLLAAINIRGKNYYN